MTGGNFMAFRVRYSINMNHEVTREHILRY